MKYSPSEQIFLEVHRLGGPASNSYDGLRPDAKKKKKKEKGSKKRIYKHDQNSRRCPSVGHASLSQVTDGHLLLLALAAS
ncbi:hypothetical protein TNCV_690711 [Trichonephila clavipes]|nr:hypothetical protein TNCV_690711 [Trichonephila clavipes]